MIQLFESSDLQTFESDGEISDKHPQHSTPIKTYYKKERVSEHRKKKTESKQYSSNKDSRVVSPHHTPTKLSSSSSPKPNTSQNESFRQNSLEVSTIQKQRTEIQLLVAELRERDKELNETVSAHQKQLLSLEQDQQRVLVLQKKCQRYKAELSNRNFQLERATSHLQGLESQCTVQLENNKEKITLLNEERKFKSNQVLSLEDRNRTLNDSLKDASCTVGQLAAREQELVTLVKLKERELIDIRQVNEEMSSHNQKLEFRARECHKREQEGFGQSVHWQKKYNQSLVDIEKLTECIRDRDEVLTHQIKQINDAQQHMIALQEALIVSSDREKCKDQLLLSLKSKQERTLSELRSVRELFDKQQREITLLQLNNNNSILDETDIEDISFVDPNIPELDKSQSNSTSTKLHKISFENRLSRFLDLDHNPPIKGGNSEEIVSREANLDDCLDTTPQTVNVKLKGDSSPGSKLQRLLSESKNMIDSLERSTVTKRLNSHTPPIHRQAHHSNNSSSSHEVLSMKKSQTKDIKPVVEKQEHLKPQQQQQHQKQQQQHQKQQQLS